MTHNPQLTFLSDFGNRDHYVASVKGVIYGICPEARITDITHKISAHNVIEAALTLAACYQCFPRGTVHLAVVDPEVGSGRGAIVVKSPNYVFVAPDNGLLSLVYEREKVATIISIEDPSYFRQPVSPIFHGRDIFGPAAAHVANGLAIQRLGPARQGLHSLGFPEVIRPDRESLLGQVVHIDRFGNVITNIRCEDLGSREEPQGPSRTDINAISIDQHLRFYAEAARGELFSLFGSTGYLEIAARQGSASEMTGARVGTSVIAHV